ncbi:primosomal protein N' [Oceanidesulfovibrio indonesiensis]|uniref:Replication restart protein PriA n=1 Tax=Oceanidesulfovibrio indonesiensis TaxID=54767 RepID=A0A7M3MEP9_9BACT|nr:primosomal protein N' [Oceanidesulfovibrio indonesiensis]TVM17375.1 primosomal protein N' [Oceanidesulfovibrio indonesiensis]
MKRPVRPVRVALASPPYANLTYEQPAWLPFEALLPGTRVLVPLGNGMRLGVVLSGEAEAPTDDAGYALKPVLWPVERTPLFSEPYLDMIRNLALRQMEYEGRILGQMLPAGLKTSRILYTVYEGGAPRRLKSAELAKLDDPAKKELARLWLSGNMEAKSIEPAAAVEYASVVKDPPWPVRPSAKRQIALLEYLWDRGPTARAVLARELGPETSTVLNTLADRGIITIGPQPAFCEAVDETGCAADSGVCYDLSEGQAAALAAFEKALDGGGNGSLVSHLLFGVTGSGKTAVYLELARACLARGRSVVLLAPEVALAINLRRAVCAVFPDRNVIFHHGYQPPKERERNFLRAATEQGPHLVVGTRSALFLPLREMGAVVLDEEHDASFKQDERLGYQAKEVAHFLAVQHGGVCILGSATPDVKTYHAAQSGLLPHHVLSERFGDAVMPSMELVDIRSIGPTDSLLAPYSAARLREVVKAGDQAIIMLNRRGYSPLMYCKECGQTAKCVNCDIGLTYHKGRERLICHYCGDSLPYPLLCPTCGSADYLPMGEGTERLEETLSAALPRGCEVLRLDRDSTRRPGRMEAIINAFARKEAQVLVGTQMLSKGHHFPDVTLVVAADADMGLNLPDYRAAERSFQLLVQVAGRAGRGERPGCVLIQTRNPDHYCWQYVQENDYEGFFTQELERRRKRKYPPFVKLGLVRLEVSPSVSDSLVLGATLAQPARDVARSIGAQFLGPVPAPIPRLRGKRRYQCLLKAADWPSVRRLYAAFHDQVCSVAGIKITLDLDPLDML